MYRFITLLLLFFVFGAPISGALAQEGGNEMAPAPGPTGWLSFFTDNRSERFTQLRLKRLEIGQRLETLQAELAELNEKAALLSKSVAPRTAFPVADIDESHLQDLNARKRRIVFDSDAFRESITQDKARMEDELQRLQLVENPTVDQVERIESLSRNIDDVPGLVDRRDSEAKFELAELDRQIADAEQRLADRAAAIKEAQDRDEDARREFEQAVSDNSKAIVAKRAEIGRVANDMDKVDAEIIGLIEVTDKDSWFKTGISFLFALLVGGVIYGFYRAISGKTEVINVIFSNDSGIQFVTIFSIVIAVILFGIIGVLEGKELSALLGGLSGYILGRSSATPAGSQDSAKQTVGENARDQAAPAPGVG